MLILVEEIGRARKKHGKGQWKVDSLVQEVKESNKERWQKNHTQAKQKIPCGLTCKKKKQHANTY